MGIICLLAIIVAQLARGAWKKPPLYVVTAALTPFASGFLVRGLARIVVAERIGPSGFAYVARNACCPLAR